MNSVYDSRAQFSSQEININIEAGKVYDLGDTGVILESSCLVSIEFKHETREFSVVASISDGSVFSSIEISILKKNQKLFVQSELNFEHEVFSQSISVCQINDPVEELLPDFGSGHFKELLINIVRRWENSPFFYDSTFDEDEQIVMDYNQKICLILMTAVAIGLRHFLCNGRAYNLSE